MSRKPVSQSLRRRSSRSVPATITAVALVAAAALALWGALVRLTSGSWSGLLSGPSDLLASLAWNSPATWVASAIALLLGLVLLFAALLPGKHTAIRIDNKGGTSQGTTENALSRQGLARLAGALVDQTDGVKSSSIAATARVVKIDARSTLHDAGPLSNELKTMLTHEFQSMGLNPVPRVKVNVRTST